MGARRFKKRIQVWQTLRVENGFGGNTLNTQLITSTWADIRSLSSNQRFSDKTSNFGISNTQLAIIVTVRQRNDLTYNSINQFVKYAGQEYTISSFPEDKNFDHNYITFIAVKEDTKVVSVSEAIDAESIFVNYSQRVLTSAGLISSEGCQVSFINALLANG